MYYVYILINLDRNKTYTGVTQDIQRRLKEHNQGKMAFSRKFAPYNILYMEKFATSSEAYTKERFYKSTSGRRNIKNMLESPPSA